MFLLWLGWRDSNPRMAGPEPAALPLGDIPILFNYIKKNNAFQEPFEHLFIDKTYIFCYNLIIQAFARTFI